MEKAIVLREYQNLRYGEAEPGDVLLPKNEWEEIRDYVLNNPDKNGHRVMEVRANTIKARNYVGVLQTSKGTTIEILPKVELGKGPNEIREREIFLRMLRRWRDGPFRSFDNADVRTLKNFPLLEAFIGMFLKDLLELTRRGLACSYNEIEENRHILKGKLLIAQHLRHNLVHKERFYVQYQEFSANRPINRLLKSTLLLLQRLSRNETNLAHIRQARLYFEDIPESANIDADLVRAGVDRTMPLYVRLFPWARLFLKRAAPATWHDRNPALALLFPMERIFEDYVAYLLSLAEGWRIRTQESPHSLIEQNPDGNAEFRLRPDIVARRKGELRVMDTKWKRVNLSTYHYGISQTDLYQLYAYGKKYQAGADEGVKPVLYLLYPKNSEFMKPRGFLYDNDLKLEIWPVDLDEEAAREAAHVPPLLINNIFGDELCKAAA